MSRFASVVDALDRDPTGKLVFVGLLTALLAIGVGHLYALRGRTELVLGLPAWLWIQLAVVAVMLGLAWAAVGLATGANRGER